MRALSVSKRRGFTVWEVLIVVVVVIIVAAVVLPMFAGTHCSARKENCQNNLKFLATALQLYWNDYDGELPSSALVSHSKKWSRSDFLRFTKTIGDPSQPSRPQTYYGVLCSYIKVKDKWHCPSDSVNVNQQGAPCSYWWKLAIDKAWYGEGCKKSYRNERDFNNTADQIVLYERTGWHDGDTNGLKNGMMINVVFLDTHVKTVFLRNSGVKYVKTPAPSSGEPAYFNSEILPDGRTKRLPEDKRARYVDPGKYVDDF